MEAEGVTGDARLNLKFQAHERMKSCGINVTDELMSRGSYTLSLTERGGLGE